MTSLALTSPSPALKEGVLTRENSCSYREVVGIDVEYINDDSDLNEEFGLDYLTLWNC
jgi:hypothetical protein